LTKGDRAATSDIPFYILVGRNSILAGLRTGGQDYPITVDLVVQRLDPASWDHGAATLAASLNVVNLWLDGRHIGYLNVPRHVTAPNFLPLEIGRGGAFTGKYWMGKLDDVRIWNIARKGSDISADLAVQPYQLQNGLVGAWHFDELAGRAFPLSGSVVDLQQGAAFSTDVHN
jgi:hypothetical protein